MFLGADPMLTLSPDLINQTFFHYLAILDDFLWSYVGFILISLFGAYFTFKTRFFQFRVLGRLRRTVQVLNEDAKKNPKGIHPLRLYFASVGGMVGLGNIVGAVMAVIIGGPGALFWLWIASLSGMLIKYSEIYLGMKYRVPNKEGGYDGGPMYYLQHAFRRKTIPYIVAFLLCIYGVEVSQFLIISDTISDTFALSKPWVVGCLLIAVIYSALGGIKRLANICCIIMPIFIILYVLMSLWVIVLNADLIPSLLKTVFIGAFQGHAPLGGFVGSTLVMAAQNGISRAVYSGDLGIGYDSIIQSESSAKHPERQARMAIFSVLTDAIICTMSIFLVLMTDIWTMDKVCIPSNCVSEALSLYFPYMPYFMAIFFFFAGYTTIISYMAVGLKCSRFLAPKWGQKMYYVYAICAFPFFSYFDQTRVFMIMSFSGGLLMLFNVVGIVKLRHKIKFD